MSLRALFDVPAPAKLNLFLHVVGRRPDGHHLLQSVFVPIDWADTLHFEIRSDGQLQRHDLTLPLPADDLCLRAARALQVASGCRLGADISISKAVPWGAGLGGGSSDAASTLLALNRLWNLGWSRSALQELGLTIGADVPFFIHGTPAWVEGIGETLTTIGVPAQQFVVLKPNVAVDTGLVFRDHGLARDTPRATMEGFEVAGSAELSRQLGSDFFGRNDLQAVTERLFPEVREAITLMAAHFGNSRMSGSGSAVFSRRDLQDVSAESTLAEMPNGWEFRACHSLAAHPLREWAAD
jgi:4-diphosphocytidyl-2-C-methyl-D-erythritol kinase